jgi:hypothetical protein
MDVIIFLSSLMMLHYCNLPAGQILFNDILLASLKLATKTGYSVDQVVT